MENPVDRNKPSLRDQTDLISAFHCNLLSTRLVAAKAGADAHRHHNRLIGYLDSRPPACGDTFGRIRQPCTLRCSNLLGQGASVCHSIRPGAEGSMIQIVSEKVAFLTLSYESLMSEMGVASRLNATSTHKQDTHTLRCTLHGLQGIRQTPLTSTTAVRMLAEGAATAAAWPEARISAPDMTGIAIRQLMLLVHGTRTAQRGPLDRPQSSTACWIKDMMTSPRAILLTGSSQEQAHIASGGGGATASPLYPPPGGLA